MDDENQRITEMEQRLLGIMKAQAELIQSFMDSTKRRLDKHKDRLDSHSERMDKHREEIDELQVSVEDLDANKQDYPNEQEERSRIAQEESDKIEAEFLAEEKERNVKMALTDILDRIEKLEEGVTDADTNADEGIVEQLKIVQVKVAALEKFIHGRLK
jgi:chromosome segregation ATPase